MYSKAEIFNLALTALLLSRRISDTDTDKSNECAVLNTLWNTALKNTITDLNLDSMSTEVSLELVATDPNEQWSYAYKYPSNCARFRRIVTGLRTDSRDSLIDKAVAIYNGNKVIYTDLEQASAEIIPNDISISVFSALSALALAFQLAALAAPLITGKGAKKLVEGINMKYVAAKAEAQRLDADENFVYSDPDVESEFVSARID